MKDTVKFRFKHKVTSRQLQMASNVFTAMSMPIEIVNTPHNDDLDMLQQIAKAENEFRKGKFTSIKTEAELNNYFESL